MRCLLNLDIDECTIETQKITWNFRNFLWRFFLLQKKSTGFTVRTNFCANASDWIFTTYEPVLNRI